MTYIVITLSADTAIAERINSLLLNEVIGSAQYFIGGKTSIDIKGKYHFINCNGVERSPLDRVISLFLNVPNSALVLFCHLQSSM